MLRLSVIPIHKPSYFLSLSSLVFVYSIILAPFSPKQNDPRTRSNSCINVHDPPSTSIQALTIFRTLFNSQSVLHRPCRNDSLTFNQQSSSLFPYTASVSKSSQQSNDPAIAAVASVATPTRLQPRHHSSSPSLRQDSLPRSCSPSSATKELHTLKATALMLTPEKVTTILASLSMQVLLELLALIVSKGPESFITSYSDDFALFVQPHGKSYQDLINLLPKVSREPMTKIIIATRHWVRYEEVGVVGRRRRHSIDSCSRDDLSLSGFGDLTSQEMPSLLDPNRACLQNLANALFSNSNMTTQVGVRTSWSHGRAQKKYMVDYRIQRSTEDSFQSTGSSEFEIGDKDAMEALDNLMLLHECADQLESWKKFSDEHAALPLPPWRTNVAKGKGSNLVRHEKKAVLVRSSGKYSLSRTSRLEGKTILHEFNQLYPKPSVISVCFYKRALIDILRSSNMYLSISLFSRARWCSTSASRFVGFDPSSPQQELIFGTIRTGYPHSY